MQWNLSEETTFLYRPVSAYRNNSHDIQRIWSIETYLYMPQQTPIAYSETFLKILPLYRKLSPTSHPTPTTTDQNVYQARTQVWKHPLSRILDATTLFLNQNSWFWGSLSAKRILSLYKVKYNSVESENNCIKLNIFFYVHRIFHYF